MAKEPSANAQPNTGDNKPKTPTELDLYKDTCKGKIVNLINSLANRLQNDPNIINRYEIQIVIKTAQDIYNLLFNEGGK